MTAPQDNATLGLATLQWRVLALETVVDTLVEIVAMQDEEIRQLKERKATDGDGIYKAV
jgi:hypothetical protein